MSSSPPSSPPAGLTEIATGWLDAYPVAVTGGDLFGDAAEPVAAHWRAVASGLSALAEGDPAVLQDTVTRHAADLGLTFRVTGDEEERDWPLNAMPLVIGASEWAGIERGLVQRANLLERLASDIYGPQQLVKDGHLPAAVIAGSPFFARKMLGRARATGAISRSIPPISRAARADSGGSCRTACACPAGSATRWRTVSP